MRRANFRQRFWQPALTGDRDRGCAPVQREVRFDDLRHTHETWLIEDQVPRVLRLQRLGHKRKDIDAQPLDHGGVQQAVLPICSPRVKTARR